MTRRVDYQSRRPTMPCGLEASVQAISELLSMMQLCEPLNVEIVYTKKQSAECYTVLLYGGTYYTNV